MNSFDFAIDLLLKMSCDDTNYIAKIKQAQVNKDYKLIINYLEGLQDGVKYLINKLNEYIH